MDLKDSYDKIKINTDEIGKYEDLILLKNKDQNKIQIDLNE